ncbi:hypothetical protein NOJ05_19690 [Neorhizobium galegae]|uniref:hypothetical protein n=1 Tax=Neorhizobium galegae TaxID=399 RepID=UPI002103D417|nr:hypothetical protein [Neorhizobium galegae]MCQ1779435.1 hypothetical protein [Neorhizobium galegae]MCQ1795595.1 hypothetical protein [Neorhizobium galegae]
MQNQNDLQPRSDVWPVTSSRKPRPKFKTITLHALPPGFDLQHWQKAHLTASVIASGKEKGVIAEDLTNCTLSEGGFIDLWYDTQDAHGILADADIEPMAVVQFRRVLDRYQKADRSILALIPDEQWLKDVAWSYQVVLFTVLHSIPLPNFFARLRQEAVKFALPHLQEYHSATYPTVRFLFEQYVAAVNAENLERRLRYQIPFHTLSRRAFFDLLHSLPRPRVIVPRA